MIISWVLEIGDVRGKCGQVVALLSRSGPVIHTQYKFARPATQPQLMQRGAFSSISQFWKDASMCPYRPDWLALGLAHPESNVFNADVYKTGHNWFVRANNNRYFIGEELIMEAPEWAAVTDPGQPTLVHSMGPPETLILTALNNPAAGDAVVIFATPPLSAGRLTLSNRQKKIYIIKPATNTPWNIIAEYIARFGIPAEGHQLFVELHYMDIAQGRIGLKRQTGCLW